MPRSHGRIAVTIWTDPDFIAMRATAQRLYMFLLSQPDLTHAGLIPLRLRRWATRVADLTGSDLEDELEYLVERRFIVTDLDTQEVLIRTFVRNDGVFRQPKVMLRMRNDAQEIESELLRAAFAREIARLPLDELSTEPGGRNKDQPSVRESVGIVVDGLLEDFAEYLGDPTGSDPGTPGDTPQETLPGTPTDGYEEPLRNPEETPDTPPEGYPEPPRVRAGAFPLPPTPFPLPQVPASPGGDAARSADLVLIAEDAGASDLAVPDEVTAQTLVGEWIDHCDARPPGRVIGQVAKELKGLLDEGIDPQRVRTALAEWNRKGLHPSTLASVVHEIANRRPSQRGQQATDDLFDAAMARALERDRKTR